MLIYIYKTANIMFVKIFYKLIIFIFLLYLILNFVTQLYSKAKNNKYNSFNQKFYKISFTAFWIIEFFLFFIFIYLTLIAPSEPIAPNDYRRVLVLPEYSIYVVFIILFGSYFTIITFDRILLFKNSFQIRKIFIALLICFFFMLLSLIYEGLKFYNTLSYFKYKVLYEKVTKSGLKLNNKGIILHLFSEKKHKSLIIKMRTQFHFILLISLLKFWHVLFIFLMLFTTTLKIWNNKDISYDLISFNIQNQLYSLIFTYLIFLLYLKKKFMFIFLVIKSCYNQTPYYYHNNLLTIECWNTIKDIFYTISDCIV